MEPQTYPAKGPSNDRLLRGFSLQQKTSRALPSSEKKSVTCTLVLLLHRPLTGLILTVGKRWEIGKKLRRALYEHSGASMLDEYSALGI